MQTITKRDLIERVAQATGNRRADVKRTISAFLDVMVSQLAEGKRIEFREFGVFETKERAERMAQNPRTLERVVVPAKRTVKFKPGRQVRERVEQAPAPAADGSAQKTKPRRARQSRVRRDDTAIRIEVKPAKAVAGV